MSGPTERERTLAGELDLASDREHVAARLRARRLTRLDNATTEDEPVRRLALLRELFGAAGQPVEVEPPFRYDYGSHIRVGDRFYANFDRITLDCAPVTIGRDVKFGPRVQVVTAYHPTDPAVRSSGREPAAPVTLRDNVWVGAGVILNPGDTIGAHPTIGDGSVVTRDVAPMSSPSASPAASPPARLTRHANEGYALPGVEGHRRGWGNGTRQGARGVGLGARRRRAPALVSPRVNRNT